MRYWVFMSESKNYRRPLCGRCSDGTTTLWALQPLNQHYIIVSNFWPRRSCGNERGLKILYLMVPFFYVSDLDDSNEKKNFFRLKDRSNNITHTLSLHNLQPATRNEQSALPVPSHGHSQLDAVTHLKLEEAFVLFLNARFPLSECKFHLACRGASV